MCINCQERVPGCHANCETYINETAKRKERSNRIFQAMMVDKVANSVQINNCLKTQHKKGKQI